MSSSAVLVLIKQANHWGSALVARGCGSICGCAYAACTWRVPNSDRLITPAGRVDDAHVVSGCQLVKVRATLLGC